MPLLGRRPRRCRCTSSPTPVTPHATRLDPVGALLSIVGRRLARLRHHRGPRAGLDARPSTLTTFAVGAADRAGLRGLGAAPRRADARHAPVRQPRLLRLPASPWPCCSSPWPAPSSCRRSTCSSSSTTRRWPPASPSSRPRSGCCSAPAPAPTSAPRSAAGVAVATGTARRRGRRSPSRPPSSTARPTCRPASGLAAVRPRRRHRHARRRPTSSWPPSRRPAPVSAPPSTTRSASSAARWASPSSAASPPPATPRPCEAACRRLPPMPDPLGPWRSTTSAPPST